MGLKLHNCSGLHERGVPGARACPGGSAAGGDQNGLNLRSASWTNNVANQLTGRGVPGYVEVVGLATPTATVQVNSTSVYRKGEYFRKELTVSNGSGPAWTSVAVSATAGPTNTTWPTGNVLTPPVGQTLQYDTDGNLTNDGVWVYGWDAENRLTQVYNTTAVPTAARKKVVCEYDPQGRRIRKTVYLWATSDYSTTPTSDVAFVYDGWNLVAEVNATPKTLVRGYVWGTDLSGSMQGAGGVGGLLWVRLSGQNPQFVAHDGNGNVVGWTDAANGAATARHEYGPFGEPIRRTGTLAAQNTFRWSTKYTDDETDLVYYGYRYYSPGSGRWPNRDPINEAGFNLVSGRKGRFVLEEEKNLYGFLDNDPLGDYDINGLSGAAGAVGTCVGGIALGIGSVPVGAIITGAVVIAGTTYIVWKLCEECKRPKGCLPCNPVAGTLMYEIAPGSSRQRGRHVGIDHVKYWKMRQVPYMNPGPNNICQCYWRFDHVDDYTLVPVPGAIPGGPPTVVSGPSLGGGIAY